MRRTGPNLSILISSCLAALSLAACGGGGGSGDDNTTNVESDPSVLDDRVTRDRQEIDIIRVWDPSDAGELTLDGLAVDLTQVAQVTAPVVGGDPLEATSITIGGDYAFVSYHEVGAPNRGAVDAFDISDASNPVLRSQLTFTNVDVNSVATVDGSRIYLAVSGNDLGYDETAGLVSYDVDDGVIDIMTFRNVALSSFVGTSVAVLGNRIFATSGNDGHLFEVSDTTFTVTASIAVDDARWVDVDGSLVAVHAGDSVRLFDATTLSQENEFPFSRADDANARAQVSLVGAKAFVTGGSEGVHAIDTAAGTLLQTVDLPPFAPWVLPPEEVVANGVGLDGSYMFIAEGAAGLFLARATQNPATLPSDSIAPFSSLSSVVLNASANAVAVQGNVLMVAAGESGVLVIEAETVSPFHDATAATSFDVDPGTVTAGRDAISWFDINGDGDLDAFLSGTSARYLENVAGVFTTFDLGNHPGSFSFVDGDEDGAVDLYFAASDELFENDGFGTFSTRTPADFSMVGAVSSQAVMDFTRDGRTDLLVMADNGNFTATNIPSFTASYQVTHSSGRGFNGAGSVVAGYGVAQTDVNGDGWVDVLYDQGGAGLRLFVSAADGTWAVDNRGLSGETGARVVMSFADYDNDDDNDLFIGGAGGGTHGVKLWRNDGATFTDVTAAAGINATLGAHAADWGDFDNDGDLDLVVSSTAAVTSLKLYINQDDGTFTLDEVPFPGSGVVSDLAWVDYDSDGDLDLSGVVVGGDAVLIRNDLDLDSFVDVLVRGKGPGGVVRGAQGVPVRLYAADGTTLLARQDIGLQRGAGSGPFRVHFGGIDPVQTYVVKVGFHTGEVTRSIVPGAETLTKGVNAFAHTIEVIEP